MPRGQAGPRPSGRQQQQKEIKMGLDMYAMTLATKPTSAVDFDATNAGDLHYWRKHPDLHGWMEDLYYRKGGAAEHFNCVNLLLTEDDLDALEADIHANNLSPTSGFFFGETDGSDTEDDLQFIAKAREAIAAGATVFYSSWW
jgi:hypothetical protein